MSLCGIIRRFFRKKAMDPVRKCQVYKDVGCAHIDGFLCDFPMCSIRHNYVRALRSAPPANEGRV